jgi:hypothetical protein
MQREFGRVRFFNSVGNVARTVSLQPRRGCDCKVASTRSKPVLAEVPEVSAFGADNPSHSTQIKRQSPRVIQHLIHFRAALIALFSLQS